MPMAFEGTPLSFLDGIFALEEDSSIFVRDTTTTISNGNNTPDHGSKADKGQDSISEWGKRPKNKGAAHPMPQDEFSMSMSSVLDLDSAYRQLSFDEAILLNQDFNSDPDILLGDMLFPKTKDESSGPGPDEEILTLKESEIREARAAGFLDDGQVKTLIPEYIRWFYKNDKSWAPFTGFDSIRLEEKYQETEAAEKLKKLDKENNASTPPDSLQEPGPSSEIQQETSRFTLVSKNYIEYMETTLGTMRQRSGSKGWFSSWMEDEGAGNASGVESATPSLPDLIEEEIQVQGEVCGEGSPTPDEHKCEKGNKEGMKKNPVTPETIVFVRGGLYEANLNALTCTSTYWPADKVEITRGTWFYDGTWQPLPHLHSERLESEHFEKFSGTQETVTYLNDGDQADDSSPTKQRPVAHRVSFPEFDVDWTSASEIYLYSKAASYQFMRSVGQRLGFQTFGHRICRGYFKPASLSDKPSEISHIVFVVHGIGQKMDTGRIVRNCATFRDCVAQMRNRYFPHQLGSHQKTEFFPVEWRSFAKLDGDIVENITPNKLLSLRQLLNATAMDIMYYTSPLYRCEIQNALKHELNRIYANFVKRHPNFESHGGKVSILAHSLGAVITYDIVTGYCFDCHLPYHGSSINMQPPPKQSEEINHEGIIVIDEMDSVTGLSIPKATKGLSFELEHFFLVGSPLAVFLALRWRTPHDPCVRNLIIPKTLCKRIYNVFHPSDPVAYRVEPLLSQSYRDVAPICVNTYNAAVQEKYEIMAKEACGYYEKPGENSTNSGPQTELQQQAPGNNSSASTSSNSQSQIRLNPFQNLTSPPSTTMDFTRGFSKFMKYWKPGNQADSIGGEEGLQSEETMTTMIASPPLPQHSCELENDLEPGLEDENSEEEESNPCRIDNDLDYRMDYVLRESNLSNSYLAAITSHTSYWSSTEIAFFVLSHIHDGHFEEFNQDKPL